MRYWADIDEVDYNKNYFPLDPYDQDTIPTAMPDSNSSDGFYCGSCHNPHLEPDSGGGYFLRSETGDAGELGRREVFCTQCHKGVHEGTSYEDMECLNCHHPHKGATSIDENPDIGRWILISEIILLVF
jgi:hypothetical protein